MSADASPQDALNPHGSAWVSANAGAGKTYILVSRLVRLMLDGVAPEKLLCLTYTRAAAAEMQSRLFDLLAEWALLDDADLQAAIGDRLGIKAAPETLHAARILFARALETPGGLRVQTIHGFCESLLKRFPLEAGLSPHFDLMDEQEAQSLQSAIMTGLLLDTKDAARAEAMAVLTRALAENDVMALGRQILAQRSHFNAAQAAANLQELARAMQLDPLRAGDGALPQAADLLAEAGQNFNATARAALAWYQSGGANDQKQAQRLQNWLAVFEKAEASDSETAWVHLRDVFFTDKGSARKTLYNKPLAAQNPQMAEAMDAAALDMARLDEQVKALANYRLTAALYDFAEALLSGYAREKNRRGMLDYDDLVAMTDAMLSHNGAAQWVLFKIDSGLEHILVDEAQDTSPTQWRVIKALAEAFFDDVGLSGRDGVPRTLFAVGDEKQSIFSFQGADPSGFARQGAYFEQMVKAIDGQFARVPMTLSWRSAPQILNAVDVLFADNAIRDGVTADNQPVEHSAERAEAIGHVEIWPAIATARTAHDIEAWQIPEMAEAGGRQKLAHAIADKISSLLQDGRQNIKPGDILVLVRKRDAFVPELSRALKRRQIDVAGADRMVLLQQLAVADMLAALDIALNPSDDMAVAIFLRSPLGGLDEEALFALAHGRTGSLFDALRMAAKKTDNDTLKAAHERLAWLLRQCDFLTPYELLAQFLGAQGGHKLLSARLGPEIDDPLSELLRLALAYEARNAASLQGFVHWLHQGSQDIKRDMEAGGGAVRIMTVHGAKGLEAPIVFLPDTCRAADGGGRDDRVQFADTGTGENVPLWRASTALRDSYNATQTDAARHAALQEEKRLLYVAMTRARDRLYIGGWLQKGRQQAPDNSWYAMLTERLGPEQQKILAAGEVPLEKSDAADNGEDASPASPAASAPTIMPEPPHWLTAPPSEAAEGYRFFGNKIFSPSGLADRGDGLAGRGLDDAALRAAAERGRIIHKLLEILPRYETSRRHGAAQAYLRHHLADESDALLAQIMALLDDAALAPLFSEAALAEAPIGGFLTRHDGTKLALSGQIDRLVETDDAIFLVDFKTGTPPESRNGGAYLTQMAAYRALMQAAQKGDKPVACALIWTQNGRMDWLDEAALDASLADILGGTRPLENQ
jgi:ATP-dependent helicase/nuclease subunit A